MVIQDFSVIQGHVFWGQWNGDKGLNNIIVFASFAKVPKT